MTRLCRRRRPACPSQRLQLELHRLVVALPQREVILRRRERARHPSRQCLGCGAFPVLEVPRRLNDLLAPFPHREIGRQELRIMIWTHPPQCELPGPKRIPNQHLDQRRRVVLRPSQV